MTYTLKQEQSCSDIPVIALSSQLNAGQETLLAYWKQQLASAPPVLELPTDCPRPPVLSCRGARQILKLPKTVSQAISSLSQREGVPLFTALLAAFKVLLYRYTGQEDILVGSPIAIRNPLEREEHRELPTNTLVLRTHVASNLSFRELLVRVQEVVLEANLHKDLPFERLVAALHSEPNLSYHPLFQVMFVLQEAMTPTWALQEQALSPLAVESASCVEGYSSPEDFAIATKFDLTLNLQETSEGIGGFFEYSTDLFDAATIARMTGHFQTLLESIVDNPDRQLSDLPLLTVAERHQLLVEWNNTSADYPKDSCYHHLFEAQVERTPDAVAVVWEDQQLTYRELNARANQLAHYLQKLGIKPDVLVAISVERSLEMVVGFLGILKAGGAYIPLDPSYPHERRAYKLRDSQAPVILTQKRLVASLPDHSAQVICLDADWDTIAQESEENPVSEATPENLAYVIYTSGSTGKPKGVAIAHQGLVNHNCAIANKYDLKTSDRVLQFSSMSFDIIIEELFPSWLVGATVVLRTEEMLSSTTNFLRFVEQQQLTILNLPTAFWHELVNGLSLVKASLPSSVRLVVVGGEKASRSAYLTWLNLVSKQVRWLNSYGPTETTVTATVYDPTIAPESDRTLSEIPIGRPIANTHIYILDRQRQPVPIGVPGELYIGGASVGLGYLNRPDLTAHKFIQNPFSDDPEARLYKTGDLVRYLPDGNIEFIGRIDFQVKIRGFRIELIEIEGALEQHPAVRQAVVLAREDEPGNKRLVAYLVLKSQQAATTSELRRFLKEKLPEYMLPSAFVLLDVLPLTPNGKVDRRALPAPNQIQQTWEETFVAPQDDLEFQLTKIWEEVLGIEPIGVRDNLFSLGAHSLLIARLSDRIEKAFNKHLPLTTIFQAPTVEQLATILRQEGWSAVEQAVTAIQPNGSKPPLFLCEGVSIYYPLVPYLGLDQPLYGLVAPSSDRKSATQNLIKELAAQYIQEMRTLQPKGPYYLAGLSFGGVVAFEIAQQLTAQGEKVALLALLDTILPDAYKQLPIYKRIYYHLCQVYQKGPGYILMQLNERVRSLKSKLMRIYSKFYLERGKEVLHTLEYHAMREVNDEAERSYRPQVYPGNVILFKAANPVDAQTSCVALDGGWGKFATGGLEIYVVPGDHLGILKEPHVKVMAEKLRICLDKAQVMSTGMH